jgi:uncharacterized protein (DUF3084 family)
MIFAFEWPIISTGFGVAGLAIIVGYKLIIDRSATKSELESLREQIHELRTHVHTIEQLYDEQRSDKHKARNDTARALTALELVRRLARECTCGALTPLTEIIDRILDEMETLPRRARLREDRG